MGKDVTPVKLVDQALDLLRKRGVALAPGLAVEQHQQMWQQFLVQRHRLCVNTHIRTSKHTHTRAHTHTTTTIACVRNSRVGDCVVWQTRA